MPAHCSISNLPISVEPVKVSLRTIGFEVSSPPISFDGPVTQEKTPFGTPARSANSHSAKAENGVAVAGFSTIVQPAAKAGPGLAGDHRRREVPRRDRGADADRLLDHDDALVGGVRRDRVAVDALALLAEPLDEGGGIGDLAARLGQRLALLGGHQGREILLVRHHQIEPFAQDLGALLGGLGAPAGQCLVGRLDRLAGLLGAHPRARCRGSRRSPGW